MSGKNNGRSSDRSSSSTLKTSSKLSVTSLGAHNKSAHQQPRHVFTHTWVETVKRESSSNYHGERPDIVITNSDETHQLQQQSERSASVPLQFIENQTSIEPKTKSKKLTQLKRRNDDAPPQLSSLPSGSGAADGSGAAHKGKRPMTHSQIPQIITEMVETPPKEEKLDYSTNKYVEHQCGKSENAGLFNDEIIVKVTQVARMAKKWKQRVLQPSDEEIAMSSQEAQLNRQRKRPLVEIPQSLRLELMEEAHQIVTKTLERYRSELGLRHKLTRITEEKCKALAQELKK